MKEKWMKMLFGRFYINNYRANYSSYFPLKVKGLILDKIFVNVHRDYFVSHESPESKSNKEFKLMSEIVLYRIYSLITLTIYIYSVKKWIYFNNWTCTRLLGRFALIFYLNCEHVLFVYILKQRRKKFCGFLKKNSRII